MKKEFKIKLIVWLSFMIFTGLISPFFYISPYENEKKVDRIVYEQDNDSFPNSTNINGEFNSTVKLVGMDENGNKIEKKRLSKPSP